VAEAGAADPAGPSYTQLAGLSVARLAALSDGIFAVVMTLLVLDLHAPARAAIRTSGDLGGALGRRWPSLVAYLMSFLTLGIFWLGQQVQLGANRRGDRSLTWLHLGFLLGISLMPFSTALLARFIGYRLVLGVYWANLLLVGAMLLACWRYAHRAGLLTPEADAGAFAVNQRRIVRAQILYALAALACVISTYVSIAVLVALQLDSAVSPRWGLLRRL
jgi:TMEM175 potassium channel family protein